MRAEFAHNQFLYFNHRKKTNILNKFLAKKIQLDKSDVIFQQIAWQIYRNNDNENFAGEIQLSNSKDDFGSKKWKKTQIYFRIIMQKTKNKTKTKQKTKPKNKEKENYTFKTL